MDGAALDQVWVLDPVEAGETAEPGDWPTGEGNCWKIAECGKLQRQPRRAGCRSPNFSPELFACDSTICSSNDVATSDAHSPSQAVGHCLACPSWRITAIGCLDAAFQLPQLHEPMVVSCTIHCRGTMWLPNVPRRNSCVFLSAIIPFTFALEQIRMRASI
jgi:hypothetical protein